jgi:CheY-like chemotaxis protein
VSVLFLVPLGRDAELAASVLVHSLRIQPLEDHEPTRTVLARLLTRASHEVLSAANAARALDLAAEHTFDLHVSDLGFPTGAADETSRLEATRSRARRDGTVAQQDWAASV